MNKQPIDDLLEQARASFKANMPLEHVEQLVQRSSGSVSKWTWKKIISSMSIIGIILVGALLFTSSPSNNTPHRILPLYPTDSIQVEPDLLAIKTLLEPTKEVARDSTPPAPPVPPTPPAPPIPPSPPVVSSPPSLLDSLGPKKTFTEYTLEIRKDNSEKELKALQKELSRYGIELKIQQLTYHSDNTIKQFKGKFETDSLFCSTQMQEHEFDIQGAFQSMQFTFRVADNKNLKYLKIQSEDFEETIECYDDKVISTSAQAQKIALEAQLAMRQVEEKMQHAQREAELARRKLHLVKEKASQSIANILRLQADSIQRIHQKELFSKYPEMESLLEGNLLLDSISNVEVYFGNIENQIAFFKELAKQDWPNMDSLLLLEKSLPEHSNAIQLELESIRLEMESMQDQLRIKKEIEEIEKNIEDKLLLEQQQLELEVKELSLEEEANQLEREAKRLRKEAKRLRKEAKKKVKK